MNPTVMGLRNKMIWRINGRPPGAGDWICTSYFGRGDLAVLDADSSRLAMWEAELSIDDFVQLYEASYEEILAEEKELEPYEWGVVLEYDRLRHAGYPDLLELITSHRDTVRSLLLSDAPALMELIHMEEPRHYDAGYAVHGLHEVVVLENRIILAGLAIEQEEI